jgi:hypothetical protein
VLCGTIFFKLLIFVMHRAGENLDGFNTAVLRIMPDGQVVSNVPYSTLAESAVAAHHNFPGMTTEIERQLEASVLETQDHTRRVLCISGAFDEEGYPL